MVAVALDLGVAAGVGVTATTWGRRSGRGRRPGWGRALEGRPRGLHQIGLARHDRDVVGAELGEFAEDEAVMPSPMEVSKVTAAMPTAMPRSVREALGLG